MTSIARITGAHRRSIPRGYAAGRFVMVAVGLGETFYTIPRIDPTSHEPYERMGLDDLRKIYFATRAAPLGPVPVEVVISTFFGFHPSVVRRHIPAVYTSATPEQVVHAERAVADQTLRRHLGDWVDSTTAKEIAVLTRNAAENCDSAGRPLFAAYTSLPWPDVSDAHLTIWHAFTLLREFRGDSHVACLVANGVDACECHLLMAAAAVGGCDCHRPFLQLGIAVDTDTPPNPNPDGGADREWPVVDRKAALNRLCDRGLLLEDGSITQSGMQLHLRIERATDAAATSLWERGDNNVERLATLLEEPVGLLRSAMANFF
jgi:hypothetical protein